MITIRLTRDQRADLRTEMLGWVDASAHITRAEQEQVARALTGPDGQDTQLPVWMAKALHRVATERAAAILRDTPAGSAEHRRILHAARLLADALQRDGFATITTTAN